MIRKLGIFMLLLVWAVSSMAQPTPESRIAITPYLPSCEDLNPHAAARLSNKLMQMAALNDMASTTGDFVLTTQYAVVDQQITPTIPQQHLVELEFVFYVIGTKEQVIVKQMTQTVRGLGRTSAKAWISAINKINSRSPQVRAFMNTAREKIVDYYAQNVPQILSKAQSLATRGEYEEAIITLSVVPDCIEEYPTVMEQMSLMYIEMLDRYALSALQDARAQIALKDYAKALESLKAVHPQSRYFAQSGEVILQIKQSIDAEQREALERELEAAEKQHALELKRMEHDQEWRMKQLEVRSQEIMADERIAQKREEQTQENLQTIHQILESIKMPSKLPKKP